ncbi:addiction module antidote protein [Burkholderia ubonensis]|uniref:DNA-binding protein n=1 Tax=Burkholderia ubonensis TaxID=101571 RepID=A0ABD4E1R2_9BURK|nr:addiction module antidote protein [Burkholderia ubonensis]KVN83510.1 DNA-binding protein [Burkholderia ubonensis]
MKISELKEFDAAEVLTDDESIQHYLALAFEDDDPRMIQRALGTVAKARGMSALARESGIKRESLYRALSDTGNPEFGTIVKVVRALGLQITVTPPAPAPAPTKRAKPATARQAKPAHA